MFCLFILAYRYWSWGRSQSCSGFFQALAWWFRRRSLALKGAFKSWEWNIAVKAINFVSTRDRRRVSRIHRFSIRICSNHWGVQDAMVDAKHERHRYASAKMKTEALASEKIMRKIVGSVYWIVVACVDWDRVLDCFCSLYAWYTHPLYWTVE